MADRPSHDDERDAYVAEVTIGEIEPPADGLVRLADPDPAWAARFAAAAAAIRAALGDRVLLLEHVGSTSVPGLAAKPIVDVLLVVGDSADEAGYVTSLEAAGYVLRIREPDWYEHRMFRLPDRSVQVHVFSGGCVEIERMLAFRDRLRTHDDERALYERSKRALAARRWATVQDYADAKGEVVEAIIARALAGPDGPD
ncbi:MAG TPA: GrpB family protein [Thermoleophilia bacterium]|nr:GrpB family protein [Thermoleophilia bacterium]